MKISPTRGPVGTPITVTVVGMGSPTYESVGAVLYDNHFAGAISANTTRGVSIFKIRASGGVGAHWIELAGSSHTVPYLNMQQSPVPWTDGHRMRFQITADKGRPEAVGRTPDGRAGDDRGADDAAEREPGRRLGRDRAAQLDERTDPVEDDHQRHRADGRPAVRRAVGQRRRQPGQLHRAVLELRQSGLGNGVAGGDGTAKTNITVPDGLGGWHAVQIVQAGQVKAQTSYFVKRTFVSIPKTVKAGQPFIVELKGVGWTQLDNTSPSRTTTRTSATRAASTATGTCASSSSPPATRART